MLDSIRMGYIGYPKRHPTIFFVNGLSLAQFIWLGVGLPVFGRG